MPFPGLNRTQVNLLINAALTSYTDSDDLATLLSGKSDTNHLHTGVYSPVAHTHDSLYAALVHNHDLAYAALGHSHDSAYAALLHDHDLDYAAIGHTHDYSLVFAALSHTHDDRYFTESEVTTLLAGKADSSHVHAADDTTSGVFDNARINWAEPSAIGGTTPAAGAFTDLTAQGGSIQLSDAGTTTAPTLLTLRHLTSGTAGISFGSNLAFEGEDAGGNQVLQARITSKYLNPLATFPQLNLVFSIRTRNGSLGTSEFDMIRIGQSALNSEAGVHFVNPFLQTAHLSFEGIHADGRMGLFSYADGIKKQIIGARGGSQIFGHGSQSSVSGLTGTFGVWPSGNLVLGSPFFGLSENNSGTHKSMFISTPNSVAANLGSWTRTDMIDFATFSSVSNTWGGVRPNMRFTALEHIFRVDGSAGSANPGTEVLRVASGEINVTGVLHGDGLRLDLTPTAESIVPTHTIIINVDGTDYKIPVVAA